MEEKSKKTIKGIANALGIFQSECPAIKKDSEAGTKFKYKYGSLPMILEVIKPHMKKAGLSFSQPVTVDSNGVEVINTILFHAGSGETLESQMLMKDVEFDRMNVLQSKGSEITYLRRYALISILGIVPEEEDTDGVGDVKKTPSQKQGSAPSPPAQNSTAKDLPWLNPMVGGEINGLWTIAVKYLADGGQIGEIKKKYRIGKANENKLLADALTFDDLPFDRKDADKILAEESEIASTETLPELDGIGSGDLQGGPGEVKPGESNVLFDTQGGGNG